MLRKTGNVLVIALIFVGAVVALSGALKSVFPAEQSSEVAQQLISPNEKVNTFPITTLGKLKNKEQKLAVIDATTKIVQKEFNAKIEQSQTAYTSVVALLSAIASAYGTTLYNKAKMYTEEEVQVIKNGK